MARLFDGADDAAYVTLDLSAYSLITVSHWGWWDSYNDNSQEPFFEFGDPNWAIAGGWISYPDFLSGASGYLIGMHTGALGWMDYFPRASAAAWHHYLVVYDRATPAHTAYVDGVLQSLTANVHNAGSYGNFANTNLNFASRGHTSLFADCRIAETTIWGGVALTTSDAVALAAGALPHYVQPDSLVYYAPMFGADSPEPDYSGNRKSATLVGTSFMQQPRVMPGLIRPNLAVADVASADVLTAPVGVFDPQLVPKGWF